MRTRSRLPNLLTPLSPIFAALALGACGFSLEPPPVEVGARESLVGAGTIVRLESTTSETLENLEVVITAPDGERRTFHLDLLPGYGVEEVGWKKLGGWEVPGGSVVNLRASGYLRALEVSLPDDPPPILP